MEIQYIVSSGAEKSSLYQGHLSKQHIAKVAYAFSFYINTGENGLSLYCTKVQEKLG
ncbi:hypothetical protein NYE25_24510 [Paenibacillus sp. FSL E2-8871]|uniref:hypothetical protein n=1 Tax=Paenibacillus sp. FSL E2-8871 TaxID=2975326 RepID=UPI0030F5D1A0